MAYLWHGIRARLRRVKCAAYVGDCSFCREWKRDKAAARRESSGRPPRASQGR